MGRSLGKGMREFKDSVSGIEDDAAHHYDDAARRAPARSVRADTRRRDDVPAEETERETVSLGERSYVCAVVTAPPPPR